ncbi:MAG: putative sulfate/molybdate transporter [bacterium]|nr:putative sulfate/molybdate transporter [bacterium]
MSIKFNKSEISGAFGDIGTDFPLLVGVLLASNMDVASVFIVFGLLQIFTGLLYKIPMPVQPLKAMAAIVITNKVSQDIIAGAAFAIGVLMFLLTFTGLVKFLSSIIPPCVVRGIQFGLGLTLISVSFQKYIPAYGLSGFFLAVVGFSLAVLFLDNKAIPVGLVLVLIGFLYSVFFLNPNIAFIDFKLPEYKVPNFKNILDGLLILVLPQLPLSLNNSIIATSKLVNDLFPDKKISINKISYTYSFMNIFVSFSGGFPSCHGAGGIMGHYAFGARTGGSVIIYGLVYLIIGFLFSNSFSEIINIFPLPILGVILFFEGLGLMLLILDSFNNKKDFIVAFITGLTAWGVPYGFVVAVLVGCILYYIPIEFKTLKNVINLKWRQ